MFLKMGQDGQIEVNKEMSKESARHDSRDGRDQVRHNNEESPLRCSWSSQFLHRRTDMQTRRPTIEDDNDSDSECTCSSRDWDLALILCRGSLAFSFVGGWDEDSRVGDTLGSSPFRRRIVAAGLAVRSFFSCMTYALAFWEGMGRRPKIDERASVPRGLVALMRRRQCHSHY